VLESCGSIGKTEMHDLEIEGTIAGSEGCFPLISGSNTDEVVCTTEVNLGVDLGGAEAIEEIWNEGKWISIFLGDLVKTMPINTKSKQAVFLFDEQDRSTAWGLRLADKAVIKILFEEFMECNCFSLGHIVNWTKRWLSAFFEMDMMIVLRIMVRKLVRFSLTEDVEIFMVFRRNL